jgi:broad-specificity NMP kinase
MNESLGDVIVLRGLPGIGKTSLAEKLALSIKPLGSNILSVDDFFTTDNGVYEFDKEKLQEAYKWNFEKFKKALESKIPLIIIDNTNIKAFHYWHYIDTAQRNNYRVSILILPHNDVSDRELSERTPHAVSKSTIYKMRREFQWDLDKKKE